MYLFCPTLTLARSPKARDHMAALVVCSGLQLQAEDAFTMLHYRGKGADGVKPLSVLMLKVSWF